MARLTLTFKGRTLQVIPIEDGDISIGRDPDNVLQIDSLAIAPRHAVVAPEGDGYNLRPVDPIYVVLVNGQKIDKHRLKHGDNIGLGKHLLIFLDDAKEWEASVTGVRNKSPEEEDTSSVTMQPSPSAAPEASLQVLRGKNIGLVIPLRKAMTRLGTEETGSAVIARRKDGYFLSTLIASDNVLINEVPIFEESVKLNHGDILKVGPHHLRFFWD
jgi:pSer/pThr/pTyr-binding forkhead associated (FHA) protein